MKRKNRYYAFQSDFISRVGDARPPPATKENDIFTRNKVLYQQRSSLTVQ